MAVLAQSLLVRFLAASLLIASSGLSLLSPVSAATWPPAASSYDQAVPMEATVTDVPPSIALKFSRAGAYTIYRKAANVTTWGAALATLPANSTSWTDTAVSTGVLYEYKAVLSGANTGVYWSNSAPVGHILSGIKVDETQPRGRVVLVVTSDVQAALPTELAQFKSDFVADGWTVHEISCTRVAKYDAYGVDTNGDGVADSGFPADHIALRNQIIALYNAYPGEVKNVIILGRAPVARTGIAGINPDGHGDRCTLSADAYYADVNGTWTDTGNNFANTTNSINRPGDNRFDPINTTQTGPVEMGFGRIDLSNSIVFEYAALRTYLQKLHRYKTASADFQPGRKIAIRDGYSNVDETGWSTGPAVSGLVNVDAFNRTDLPLPVSGNDADQAYSALHGPYLFYFKGDGAPAFSPGGKAVFVTGMQSNWGYWWETQNAMQTQLSEDNFTLSVTWSIWGVRYFYHRMAMGLDAGDMMRMSINNTSPVTGTYQWATDTYGNGDYSGSLFMSHMGDPTLRLFMFEPPSDLAIRKNNNAPLLTWSASPATGVIGYHVYRASTAAGPFVRITSSPVAATQFVDSTTATGPVSYMVRAVRLETSASGSFYNASLGAVSSIDFDATPAALQVPGTTLPDARCAQAYSVALPVTGGIPAYTWTLISGTLPQGLTLISNGTISGTPVRQETTTFIVRVTDLVNVSADQTYTINTLSEQTLVVPATISAATVSTSTGTNYSGSDSFLVNNQRDAYVRFDLSTVPSRNVYLRARLRLFASPSTANGYPFLEAALLSDSDDTMAENTITYSHSPAVNDAFITVRTDTLPTPGGYVDIDVTPLFQETLANDPARILGLKIFTKTANQSLTVGSRRAFGDNQVRLILDVTDAPKITMTSPASGAAFARPGTGLQLQANISPLSPRTASLTWSQVAGPGTITLGTPAAATTTATFSTQGDYTLRLYADDGTLRSSRDIVVRVFDSTVKGPVSGLKMRLPLDETFDTMAGDVSANTPANSGTVIGNNTSWMPADGRVGGALNFTGSAQRIQIPDNSSRPLDGDTAISLSYWMYINGIDATTRAILCKRTSAGVGESYTVTLSNPAKLTVNIGTYGPTNRLTSATTLVAGQWYHVAIIFDVAQRPAERLKLYLNGIPDKFLTTTQTEVPRFTSPLYVGGFDSTNGNSFNGRLDEIRIYNRGLTPAEITDLASASPVNLAPVLTGSSTFTGNVGQSLPIIAGVVDDALPGPSLLMNWQQLSGPSTLSIANAFSTSTTALGSTAGTYGLRFTATDGDVTSFVDFSATLEGQTYAGWVSAHGLTGSDAGESATPDNDGVPNLLKFATGLEPGTSSSSGPATVSTTNNHLVIAFNRLSPAPLDYVVEATQDLVAWEPIATLASGSSTWTGSASVTETGTGSLLSVSVTDPVALIEQPRRFLRLRITLP
ncbi:LamG-like jellyroll fold domain-containing protein [Rariglobus hedericola]|uniref:LamG domain-containing protein n=1 Tax=Rariglobus hedericola TaxID=2597822 RepID=A0A556QPF4_9BACT|nr:LamG-like jellyroll fold domain-containing protein [Rariglobus hedericola]TSJ78524.1 LamG domain-containing protein [Rariglobus hedericola]